MVRTGDGGHCNDGVHPFCCILATIIDCFDRSTITVTTEKYVTIIDKDILIITYLLFIAWEPLLIQIIENT